MTPASQTGPIVRRATSADLPRIGRLGALLIEEHHAFDSRRFLAARQRTPTDYASFLSTQLEDPDVAVLVADHNGDVIGYAYAAVEGYDYMALRGPAGVLHDVIVDPEHRGRGVGRLLLDATLAYLKSRGAPRVVLSTAERNEPAQRLFASVGFRRTMIEMTREAEEQPETEGGQMEIKRSGSQPSGKGPAEYFTGMVRVDPLFQAPDPARVLAANVTFEPGARTNWHTHPLGQTLIVTAGCGLVQSGGGPIRRIRPGDVVWCPPGEKHWHGATATTAMTHIAILEHKDGKNVEWMERVTDAEYAAGESAE